MQRNLVEQLAKPLSTFKSVVSSDKLTEHWIQRIQSTLKMHIFCQASTFYHIYLYLPVFPSECHQRIILTIFIVTMSIPNVKITVFLELSHFCRKICAPKRLFAWWRGGWNAIWQNSGWKWFRVAGSSLSPVNTHSFKLKLTSTHYSGINWKSLYQT